LHISSGGQLKSAAATIGGGATGSGTVTVTGNESSWNASGNIDVGGSGSGTLTVADGGNVTTTGVLNINDPAGTAIIGTLNLSGGSITAQSVTRAGTLNWTDGTLTVFGGTFNNGSANLTINGGGAGDLPTLRMAGGATGTNFATTTLTAGSSRGGAIEITGGSTLAVSEAHLGALDGGSGTLTVSGLNSQFATTGILAVGGNGSMAAGAGVVNVASSGEVRVQGMLKLWAGGTINLSGGTLKFATLDPRGGRVNFNSGRVQFLSSQTLGASDGIADALLGPAHSLGLGQTLDAAGGALTVATNLTLDGGRLEGSQLIIAPAGEVRLADPSARIANTSVRNQGILVGTGSIFSALQNETAGQVRVGLGERLVFSGASSNTNNGLVDVNGGAVEFVGPTTNNSQTPATGSIAGRNGVLRFQGGLTNAGSIVFSNGTMDVFGDINNVANLPTTGRIVVSGGGTANFYDDIANGGTIQVSAAGSLQSTAVFFGSLTGNGVGGTGHVFIEGDARPGFSPGTMAFGGDVSFGPDSTLAIELGGSQPGLQHDRVTVADRANLAGTLEVTLLDGFVPQPGQQFTVMTYGSHEGTFDRISIGGASGLGWTLNYDSTAVTLTAGGLAGDLDLDGVVGESDLALFVQHLGTRSGATFLQGDFNNDGRTSLADLRILRNNFGVRVAPAVSAAAVPEPATALFAIALAVLAAAATRRNRRRVAAAANCAA
jgi:T5SS/PEP-CTERM-associated repeat protein